MPRMRYLLLATLFATVALLAACPDGDAAATATDEHEEQTSSDAVLATYFSDIEAAKAEHDELLPPPMTTGDGTLPPPGSNEAQSQLEFLIRTLTQDNVAITGMLLAMEGIDVPSELESEHGEVVQTLEARFDYQETLLAQFRTGQRETFEQVERREGDIRQHGTALCVIQSDADHYGMTVYLGCDVEDVLKLRRTDRTTEHLATGEFACNQAPLGEPANELASFVDFLNRLNEAVDVYQITAEGERIFVLSLDPGEEHIQVTYVATRWLVSDTDGNCIGTFTARDVGTNVEIVPENPNN